MHSRGILASAYHISNVNNSQPFQYHCIQLFFFLGYQIPNRCFSDIVCHVKNLKMQVAYCNLHGKLDEVHSPHVKMIIMDIITSGVK